MHPIKISGLVLIFCLAVFSRCLQADFGFEFSTGQNFTENLLLDSSDLADSYSVSNAKLNFYPLSRIQMSLTSEYTYYGGTIGLGNILSGGEITIIPLSENSPFLLYLFGRYNNRSYREEFRVYNTNEIVATTSLAIKPISRLQLRSGFNYKNTAYSNSNEADKEIFEIFGGFNLTLLGLNSLDLEAGYSFAQILAIDTSTIYSYPQVLEEVDTDLKKFYISPRFSRPIGKKLGIAITYSYSEFVDYESPLVYSYASGLLSPWASVWAGNSLILNLKSYHIPRAIVTAGYGYWNKDYLNTLEGMDYIRIRKDEVSRYFLSISWPLPTSAGPYLEPALRVDYTDSISSHRLYKYRGLSAAVSLLVRL